MTCVRRVNQPTFTYITSVRNFEITHLYPTDVVSILFCPRLVVIYLLILGYILISILLVLGSFAISLFPLRMPTGAEKRGEKTKIQKKTEKEKPPGLKGEWRNYIFNWLSCSTLVFALNYS